MELSGQEVRFKLTTKVSSGSAEHADTTDAMCQNYSVSDWISGIASGQW